MSSRPAIGHFPPRRRENLVATSPDIPVFPMVMSLVGVAVVMPIVIYPFTYTIWLAFDLAVRRPEAPELSAAAAAVEASALSRR